MANKNFAQFPAYGITSNGMPVNGGQQWLVGYNDTTGGEVKTQVRDLFTNLYLASGINMSFDTGYVPGIAKNLYMGTGGTKFYPDNRVLQDNGGMFTNIVFGSYCAVSGQGGIILGNAHNYWTNTQNSDSQYFARMYNLVMGNGVQLSASFAMPWGNIFAGGNSTYKMLNAKNQLVEWGLPIFANGVANLINVLSSEKPYLGQTTNGYQLSTYYGGLGCSIFQSGNNNEIHSSAEGGYINNLGPNEQYPGIFQMGWGSRIYGALQGCVQMATGASVISGAGNTAFQFGGYGNTIHEGVQVFQFGGYNNYINNAGLCGHGGTVNFGNGSYLGNIVHTAPDGSTGRNQNTCGSLFNLGSNNRVSNANGFVAGEDNRVWSDNSFVFGDRNKVGICQWFGGSICGNGINNYVFGTDNSTGGIWWGNYTDNNTLNALDPVMSIGRGLSSNSLCATTIIGTSGVFYRIGGGFIVGHGHFLKDGYFGRPIIMGSNVRYDNRYDTGPGFNDVFVVALDRENIKRGSYTAVKRSEQFLLSARGGLFVPGKIGIGIDTMTNPMSAVVSIRGNIQGYAGVENGLYVGANIAFGDNCLADSYNSAAFGEYCNALGEGSFACGMYNYATGDGSHVEGYFNQAVGFAAHAEGTNCSAYGEYSHAEGADTITTGYGSHAEGNSTRANGAGSHAEGVLTRALSAYTHAAGAYAVAQHDVSWIWQSARSWDSFMVPTSAKLAFTTRTNQFLVSAEGGVFIPGKIGIGIDTMTSTTSAALHVNAAANIIFANLPTSPTGLPAGALWNNAGTLKIV